MYTFISLLRGINVGGQKQIRIPELAKLYEDAGFTNVRTYVQSGNIIFDTSERDQSVLSEVIERRILKIYKFSVEAFIRTPKDFKQLSDNNPFLKARHEDPAKLHVTFLKSTPAKSQINKIEIPDGSTDEYYIKEKEIYLFCPNGYGRTKLSNTFFEKKLDIPATTRNWNTINALYKITAGN